MRKAKVEIPKGKFQMGNFKVQKIKKVKG